MTPIRPDDLNSRRCRQLSNLVGRGLHDKGTTEIIPAGQAVKTETLQGLLDLHHGLWGA